MSVNNLNQVRGGNGTSAVSQSDNNIINNNNINNNNSNNNNRVSNVSKINTTKITDVVSTRNIGRISRGDKGKELNRAPSMANLSITIPIHPAASQIADREEVIRSYPYELQLVILAIIQFLCGVITVFWSLVLSNPGKIMGNFYWNNIFLLISGICGLYLVYCSEKKHPMRPGFCLSATKMLSLFSAVLTIITCLSVCVSSAIRFVHLLGMECTPAQVLNVTCICRPRGEPPDSFEGAVRYMDFSCNDIEILKFNPLSSCIMNSVYFLCVVLYPGRNRISAQPSS